VFVNLLRLRILRRLPSFRYQPICSKLISKHDGEQHNDGQLNVEDVIFCPWMENSPVCHFCPSMWTDKSGQCRLFSIHRIAVSFTFCPQKT